MVNDMLIAVERFLRRLAGGLLLALLPGAPVHGQDLPAPAPGEAVFTVFVRSVPVGVERVGVTRTDGGWRINSIGQLGPPVDLDIRSFQIDYDQDWRPLQLDIDSARNDSSYAVATTFAGGTATNEIRQGDERLTSTMEITPDAVVLPDFFFGAYEALAVRLGARRDGEEIAVYAAPQREITAVVESVRSQPIQTADIQLSALIYHTELQYDTQRLDADIWVDENNRLLRVTFPALRLDVARQDLALVSTRLTTGRSAGETDVRVPTRGFSLAASVTTPANREQPPRGWPAVLLVPGIGLVDRDENLAGVPIFAELAAALSEAGYLVLRYDKRGMGQSGGRAESAALDSYADDVLAVVRYLERRDDVDRDRLVVAAHGEGSWIALQAAARENDIDALALLAAPGTPGAELVLEQQQLRLEQYETPQDEREQQIALQQRIIAAVLDEGAWDGVPGNMRQRADTPWFRSFLEFDPAQVVRRTRQPVLIVHGKLDRQIPVAHAGRLAEMLEARRRREATLEVARLAGIDHRLLDSSAGAIDQYSQLLDRQVSSAVIATLTDWMDRTVPARR